MRNLMSDAVMPETEVQYEVWQDDFIVASADTLSDAQHYSVIYQQDGPVKEVTAVTHRFPGFDIVSAMLAASTPVGGWEDISTAPKDGTPILAACGPCVEKLAWFDGWGEGVVTPPSGPAWGLASEAGDRIESEGWDTGTGCYLTPTQKPTHWMPLPPPPSVSTGSRPQEAAPTEQASDGCSSNEGSGT